MNARKIIADATTAARNDHAHHLLAGMDEPFRIIAEMRWKFYQAHIAAGFDEDDAMFFTVNCMEVGG
jgi:hypothetical protein